MRDDRFTLLGAPGQEWLAVQRIRLVDVDGAVDAVQAFLEEHRMTRASWWLSERSTPADVEEQLLARGLFVVEGDYLIDGMLTTTEPASGPGGIEVRVSGDRYEALIDGEVVGHARANFTPRGVLMFGGFTEPHARGRGVYRTLVRARWDDAVARGTPALAVQAKSTSAPILAQLGFEKVCQFRRLQSERHA